MVALKAPTPPRKNQAFRAADLVWNNEDTVIVLLSSTNTDGRYPYGYKWLQKFSVDDGETVGAHLNLCAPGILPDGLRDGPSSNLEGMAWYQEGKRLVLVNDFDKGPATAVLIDVQSWPTVGDPASCD